MSRRIILIASVLGLLVAPAPTAQANEALALAELIDQHIQARLDEEGLQRVPQADDAEFLRRAFLDLHGVVPSAERAARFLDNRDPRNGPR
jgi:predicted RNA-binding Zn ribbon-like protein